MALLLMASLDRQPRRRWVFKMDLNALLPLAIPTLLGMLIPFLVNTVSNRLVPLPPAIQSFVYVALSALAAIVPTITYNNDLKGYFTALGIAWIVSMRTHYTQIPDRVISPYQPRHAKIDDTPATM